MLRWLAPIFLLAALVACSGASKFTIKGMVTAQESEQFTSACDSYKLTNASVTVKNEAGTVIASTQTGGNIAPQPTPMPADEQQGGANYATSKALSDLLTFDSRSDACQVAFTATVPRAQFYQFTIGTHGAPTYSFDQLKGMKWHLDLSLGQ